MKTESAVEEDTWGRYEAIVCERIVGWSEEEEGVSFGLGYERRRISRKGTPSFDEDGI